MPDRKLTSVSLRTEYRSSEHDLVGDFYIPCLNSSCYYDRAVGYFRSSVLLVVGRPLIQFARAGGKARIVCSVDLAPEDIQAIKEGYAERRQVVDAALVRELDSLLADATTHERTVALATLVRLRALELKVAVPRFGQGIFHDKLGLFRDPNGNVVTFRGSSNESLSAWHPGGNHESFEVFWSWRSADDRERIAAHLRYFERLWEGDLPGLDVDFLPKVAMERLTTHAASRLEDLESTLSRSGRQLLEHQRASIEAWRHNGSMGILAHATGSGKTLTALTIVRDHVREGRPALIVVPSALLQRQWAEEIHREIPDAMLLICGAGHNDWREGDRLEAFTAEAATLGPRICLTTIDTAATAAFRRRVRDGAHLLIVVDEVHVVGSLQRSRLLEVKAGLRLGLSATPERYGDPVGTSKIFEYFGGVVQPRITLSDAIEMGRLVPYRYHPHFVRLTEDEAKEWKELTARIGRALASSDDRDHGLPEHVKRLLIMRSRIAKLAANKVALAREVLTREFRSGQYWLVYCEGSRQTALVRRELESAGLSVFEYHTEVADDLEQILEWYHAYGGVVVAIRCLDEGVDIPETSHALILASSQNPRQYIQRRGRVLRVSERRLEKQVADIHDALVLPDDVDSTTEIRSLTLSEFRRAVHFAHGALNRSALMDLHRVAIDLGIDLSSDEGGLEDEWA